MEKKGIKYWSMVAGGVGGGVFYFFFALFDFGIEAVDWKDPLLTGMFLGLLALGATIFQSFLGGAPLKSLPAGILFGILAFLAGALIAIAVQSQGIALFAATAGGVVVGVLILGSIGSWIEKWKDHGFHPVKFRTTICFSGMVIGVVLMIILPNLDPSTPEGNWGIIVFTGMLGLWLGSLIDWMAKLRAESR